MKGSVFLLLLLAAVASAKPWGVYYTPAGPRYHFYSKARPLRRGARLCLGKYPRGVTFMCRGNMRAPVRMYVNHRLYRVEWKYPYTTSTTLGWVAPTRGLRWNKWNNVKCTSGKRGGASFSVYFFVGLCATPRRKPWRAPRRKPWRKPRARSKPRKVFRRARKAFRKALKKVNPWARHMRYKPKAVPKRKPRADVIIHKRKRKVIRRKPKTVHRRRMPKPVRRVRRFIKRVAKRKPIQRARPVFKPKPKPAFRPKKNSPLKWRGNCVVLDGRVPTMAWRLPWGWSRQPGGGVTYKKGDKFAGVFRPGTAPLRWQFWVPKKSKYAIVLDMSTTHWTEHNDVFLRFTYGRGLHAKRFGKTLILGRGWNKAYHNKNGRMLGAFTKDFDPHSFVTADELVPSKRYWIIVGARSTQITIHRILLVACSGRTCDYTNKEFYRNLAQCGKY